MNGTKTIWILAAALVGAAVALALLPSKEPVPGLAPQGEAGEALPDSSVPPPEAPPATATQPTAPAPTTAPAAAPATAPAAPVEKPAPAAGSLSLGLDQTIGNCKIIPGNIVLKRDPKSGRESMLADDRYTIRGSGTQGDPYLVSWECLASASDTYIPRLKQFEIPQRVALLNGAWVRISGYLLFPLYEKESAQLTIAFNQYDGCCIGIPPTAYDAIEVRLPKPAKRAGGHASFAFGTVEGKLSVDPYLVEGWLAGLYVMEETELTQGQQPEL